MGKEYSYSELKQMQDSAIERVRRMQAKAKREIEDSGITQSEHTENNKHEVKADREKGDGKKPSPPDRDISTLLPILLLLMSEGADSLLLLALVYIMS